MNCIIIEDQLPAQRILEKYIEDSGSFNLVGIFSDTMQAMKTLNTESIDVIFLDIHLPKLSGIDFLKSIPNRSQVILTTAFPDYALESYELNVVDYLLKPFSFQRFIKAVSKLTLKNKSLLTEKSNQRFKNEIFLKSGHEHIRININEVLYINSDSDYTDIYTSSKKHISSESLKYWENKLDEFNFLRIHKSYIVNLAKIEKISSNQVFISQNVRIPIGRTYKNVLSEKLMD